jgi:superfamily II DNA or RNA helicase
MHAKMQFTGMWRDYQQRVLDEFDAHISDNKVHVVAAPGSGKTILGLELMRRLARPAIVLSPTRAIRDQWGARLVPLFMAEHPDDDLLSFELDAPKHMTSSTYQGLYALWSGADKGRFERFIDTLNKAGPLCLILDEAHHLRREWWNALQALVDALPDAQLIALTATPPYDAPFAEWAKYDAICGAIDLEIGVAELVRNGDLCPHQDHILFSSPGEDALALLDARRRGLMMVQERLRDDDELIQLLQNHVWLLQPESHIEPILEAPEMLSAILVHLNHWSCELPVPPLELLGVSKHDVPLLSEFWLETLLNGLLFTHADIFLIGKERAKNLKSMLDKYGLIEGHKVCLRESRKLFTLMADSIAKLDSITTIAKAEAASLGADLRMVVLADHVRASEMAQIGKDTYRPTKLGIIPIFEILRRSQISGQSIAVLTGTLVIMPDTALPAFKERAAKRGCTNAEIGTVAVKGAPGYSQLNLSGNVARLCLEIVTAQFCSGEISILIGTQALLGEGWDAPALNTLVLASNSAAYMLSNQMRGRAIRIDPARRDKVSNIWHLATVDALPETPVEQLAQNFSWGRLNSGEAIKSDYDLLSRRFAAFEGISNSPSLLIESGLERLAFRNTDGPDGANRAMLARAADRPAIAEKWRLSLGDAPARAHVRETASANYAPRTLSWNDTLHWLGMTAISSGAFAAANELRHASGIENFAMLGMGLSAAATIAALPKLFKAGRLLVRNGSLEGSVVQVGCAVAESLSEAGLIKEAQHWRSAFSVRQSESGRVDLTVDSVSRSSERMILEAIAELLGPVRNPRYLLVRKSRLGIVRRMDYHAVPTALGQRKEWAELFHKHWKGHLGSSDLIFARTAGGRIMLIRARAKSFAAGFQRRVERRSAWM